MANLLGILATLIGAWVILMWLSGLLTRCVVDPIGHATLNALGY